MFTYSQIESVDQVPRLETNLIVLEPLTEEDAPDVFAFTGHQAVTETVTWNGHRDVMDSRNYIQSTQSKISFQQGHLFLVWGVREKKTNALIGMISLTELAPIRAQLGYVFHYDHWKRSLPMESLLLVEDYVFQQFPEIERLQARCFPTNTASRSFLEKMGMEFEGVNHSMMRVRGEVVDLTCYAMTRKRWNFIQQLLPNNRPWVEDGSEHI